MRPWTLALLGLVPLVGVAMVGIGVAGGAVPFAHLTKVGLSLAFGAVLLLYCAVSMRGARGGRRAAAWLVASLALAEGAGAAVVLASPERVGAALVRSNAERMGDLLVGHLDAFGAGPDTAALVDGLLEEAPYQQIYALHLAHRDVSLAHEVPDRTVVRLAGDGPVAALRALDGAYRTFGNDGGLLAPVVASLDGRSLDLPEPLLADNLALLAELAPPAAGFSRLELRLAEVAAEQVEEQWDALLPGDRAIGQMVLDGREAGNHVVMLDARGAPAGLAVLTEAFHARYLRLEERGAGGGKIVRLRYRELRTGDIVETDRGPRPTDMVSAELMIRMQSGGEVIFDRSYRGTSPRDAWREASGDVSLRESYRLAAVSALNEELAADFAAVRVE